MQGFAEHLMQRGPRPEGLQLLMLYEHKLADSNKAAGPSARKSRQRSAAAIFSESRSSQHMGFLPWRTLGKALNAQHSRLGYRSSHNQHLELIYPQIKSNQRPMSWNVRPAVCWFTLVSWKSIFLRNTRLVCLSAFLSAASGRAVSPTPYSCVKPSQRATKICSLASSFLLIGPCILFHTSFVKAQTNSKQSD